jgi:hypothetical protein
VSAKQERVTRCRTNPVGDAMIALMREQGGGVSWSVCTLDGWMNDAAHIAGVRLWRGMNPHPANRMIVGASWLRRDERFEKSLIHADDTRGAARRLTLFTLKPSYREPANIGGGQEKQS